MAIVDITHDEKLPDDRDCDAKKVSRSDVSQQNTSQENWGAECSEFTIKQKTFSSFPVKQDTRLLAKPRVIRRSLSDRNMNSENLSNEVQEDIEKFTLPKVNSHRNSNGSNNNNTCYKNKNLGKNFNGTNSSYSIKKNNSREGNIKFVDKTVRGGDSSLVNKNNTCTFTGETENVTKTIKKICFSDPIDSECVEKVISSVTERIKADRTVSKSNLMDSSRMELGVELSNSQTSVVNHATRLSKFSYPRTIDDVRPASESLDKIETKQPDSILRNEKSNCAGSLVNPTADNISASGKIAKTEANPIFEDCSSQDVPTGMVQKSNTSGIESGDRTVVTSVWGPPIADRYENKATSSYDSCKNVNSVNDSTKHLSASDCCNSTNRDIAVEKDCSTLYVNRGNAEQAHDSTNIGNHPIDSSYRSEFREIVSSFLKAKENEIIDLLMRQFMSEKMLLGTLAPAGGNYLSTPQEERQAPVQQEHFYPPVNARPPQSCETGVGQCHALQVGNPSPEQNKDKDADTVDKERIEEVLKLVVKQMIVKYPEIKDCNKFSDLPTDNQLPPYASQQLHSSQYNMMLNNFQSQQVPMSPVCQVAPHFVPQQIPALSHSHDQLASTLLMQHQMLIAAQSQVGMPKSQYLSDLAPVEPPPEVPHDANNGEQQFMPQSLPIMRSQVNPESAVQPQPAEQQIPGPQFVPNMQYLPVPMIQQQLVSPKGSSEPDLSKQQFVPMGPMASVPLHLQNLPVSPSQNISYLKQQFEKQQLFDYYAFQQQLKGQQIQPANGGWLQHPWSTGQNEIGESVAHEQSGGAMPFEFANNVIKDAGGEAFEGSVQNTDVPTGSTDFTVAPAPLSVATPNDSLQKNLVGNAHVKESQWFNDQNSGVVARASDNSEQVTPNGGNLQEAGVDSGVYRYGNVAPVSGGWSNNRWLPQPGMPVPLPGFHSGPPPWQNVMNRQPQHQPSRGRGRLEL